MQLDHTVLPLDRLSVVDTFDATTIEEVNRSFVVPMPRVDSVARRLFDVTAAGLLFVLTSWLFLLTALLIKLDSRGPVFYRQKRLGKHGRPFYVLKFRSMYLDAEARLKYILENDPAAAAEYEVFRKLRDDPRVTPVGRLLRRLSIDELPQLLNVLSGEMSLIGPRAYLPREVAAMMGHHHMILRVKPGITGLWQVSGRNRLSFEDRVRLDIEYVRTRTTAGDALILLKTIPVVLKADGAC